MALNLKYGSSGDDVKKLQEMLNSNGANLDVDGKFGPKTESALKAYQQKNGMEVTGVYTGETTGTITGNGWQGSIVGSSPTTQSPAAPQLYKPNGYSSGYEAQLQQTIQDILNRKPFEYDFNADKLYQQYSDMYQKQGRLAMEDTMGKAATLTGGYGNSYAQQVGQQTYQHYLDQSNAIIPELYQLALSRYNAESDALADRYGMLSGLENQDFDRWYAAQQWQQQYGTPLGGSVGSTGSTSGGSGNPASPGGGKGYDNHGMAESTIKTMQYSLGVEADGKWGPESIAAAGGIKDPREAWNLYNQGLIGKPVGPAADLFEDYISQKQEEYRGNSGSPTGGEEIVPTESEKTRYIINHTTTNDKAKIRAAINREYENGGLTDGEAAYLMDYYGL